jgi:hypothetical protein
MPSKQPTTNSQLPDRLYGEHYPDSFLDVSRPVRESNVATLGDYIRHLQKVDKQSNQSSESNKPPISCKFCYDIGYDASGQQCTCAEQPSNNGWIKCPDSGKLCSVIDCPDGCKGDKHDGFSDNLDYTGIPIPTPQRQSKEFGWPCVVVGAVCETWNTTAECVSGREHSEGDTERDINAGLNNDEPAATNGL